VFDKARFWQRNMDVPINDRQKKVINRLLDARRDGFAGGLTNRKYASLAGVSRATALREIQDLLHKGLLRQRPGKGRSVSYDLVWDEAELSNTTATQ
jgi:Fic family protein